MKTNVWIFGAVPDQHPAETKQFERVINILISALRGREPWIVMLRDFRYQHTTNLEIPGDVDWKGQYDLIMITEHRIVTYELKAYCVDLRYATTTGRPWKIKRACSDSAERRESPLAEHPDSVLI